MWAAHVRRTRRKQIVTYVVERILVGVYTVDDLSVDELGGGLVEAGVVPGREQLLAVLEAPWSSRLGPALAARQLLALGDGVHHVVQTAAQRRHLHTGIHAPRTLFVTQVHACIHAYIQTLDNAHSSQARGLNLRRGRSLGGKRTVDINDEQRDEFLDEI